MRIGCWDFGVGYTLPVHAAELQAIKTVLEICKNRGFNTIQLCSDSLEALNLVFRYSGQDHRFREIINPTRDLIYDYWDLELHFSCRESIHCADILTKAGHRSSNNTTIFLNIPPGSVQAVLEDKAISA